MGTLARRLAPRLIEQITSERTRALQRKLAEWRRRLNGAPHRVTYFHQVDDPYSHLTAQTLAQLIEHFDVRLQPLLVGPPSDAAAPERARLQSYARKDAADIAPHLGLNMPAAAALPSVDRVRRANAVLADALAAGNFPNAVVPVGVALWRNDDPSLLALGQRFGEASATAVAATLAAGDRQRQRLGHYLSATFHYGGEWYWGVDRLHYLEDRLEKLGLRRPDSPAAPIVSPPAPKSGPLGAGPAARLVLEYFVSVRSPYTYLSLQRTFDLADSLAVELRLRPVLPMVMRGLPVPFVKRLYIVRDAKREAERVGVPFGRVADPVGRPVERVLSLFPWAREQGRERELLLCFMRAAWADGADTGSDRGLQRVAEAAGLDWERARRHVDRDDGWRAEVDANREALLGLGLWGVPSYRLRGPTGYDDFTTWGQDRLWLLESTIRGRLAGRNAAAQESSPLGPREVDGPTTSSN